MMNTQLPVAVNNAHLLREWRKDQGISHEDVCGILHISIATLYRIEAGITQPRIDRCNDIVSMTHGKIRYRDLIPNFKPEYA